MRRRVPAFAATAALLLTLVSAIVPPDPTWAQGRPGAPGQQNRPEARDDELLVKFRPGVGANEQAAAHGQAGGQPHREIPGLDVKVVKVPAGQAPGRVRAYQQNPNVEYAELNGIGYVTWMPGDDSFAQQWGLNNTGLTGGKVDADIDAPRAWDLTRGVSSKGVRSRIAILDTGVREDHPDLAGKVVDRWNWTFAPSVDDVHGHGTHVAGIAAAATNNTTGIAGACPECEIVSGKVCDDSGGCNYDFMANGVLWAVGCDWRDWRGNCLNPVRAKSINLSIAGTYNSITMRDAINKAWSRGRRLPALPATTAGARSSTRPGTPTASRSPRPTPPISGPRSRTTGPGSTLRPRASASSAA